jgi:putative transposase
MKYDAAKHKRRSIRLKGYDYSAPGAYFITICTHQRQCLFGSIVAGQVELNATGLWVQACWQRLPYHFLTLTLDVFVIMPNHLHGLLWLGDTSGGDGNGDTSRGGNDTSGGDGNGDTSRGGNDTSGGDGNGDTSRGGNDTSGGDGNGDTSRRGEAFGQKFLEQPKISRPNASPLPNPNVAPIQPNGTQPGTIAAIMQNFKSVSTRRINQLQNSAGRPLWQRNYYENVVRDNTALQRIRSYIRNNPLAW